MAQPMVVRSLEIEEAMEEMALCPFCGARQGLEGMAFVRYDIRSKGNKWYYVSCWMCGARGATNDTPLLAIESWNTRKEREWTPLTNRTVLLPGGQKFTHLMLYEDGKFVSFIDYIEEEISAEKDGIVTKIDIDLGEYRIGRRR